MGPFDVRVAVLGMIEDPTVTADDVDIRGPVDPHAIRRFEADSGLALPPAVRDWLGHHNGGGIGYRYTLGLGTGEW